MRPLVSVLVILVLAASALGAADATPPASVPASQPQAPAASAPAATTSASASNGVPLSAKASTAAATGKAAEIQYRTFTLRNAQVEVAISDYHGAIKSFSLLDSHPIAQHDWQIRKLTSAGLTPLDPSQPLGVLDDFNPNGNKHNWIDGVGLEASGSQPWSVVTSEKTRLVLEHRDATTNLRYRMSYTLPPEGMALTTSCQIDNDGTFEANLKPRVIPLNGIHQDDPSSDAAYLAVAYHTGGTAGSQTAISLPIGTPQVLDPTGASLDYVALKSRFFAALWEPGALLLSGAGASPVAAPASPAAPAAAGGESGGPGTVVAPVPVATTGSQPKVTAVGYVMSANRGAEKQAYISAEYGAVALKPGASATFDWRLIITSMRHDDLARLSDVERNVEYTDGYYKFFKVLAKILTYSLQIVAKVVVNYGVALIVLTFLIKLILHRTTFKQQESVMKMQKLAPDLKLLQEQYKGDKQKLYVKQTELWKKHGVNPLGGCLPMLIQMPIFIALFQAFCHSADMRSQSFLWINDLTLPDQIYGFSLLTSNITINPLPLIYMAVTVWMSLTQKLPTGGDPQQEQMAKMMRWMPVVLGAIFYNMPSGLVLYFTVNAILTTIEIKMVKRKLGVA